MNLNVMALGVSTSTICCFSEKIEIKTEENIEWSLKREVVC